MDEVSDFIARHGVTRCPTVALEPTTADVSADLAGHDSPDMRRFKKNSERMTKLNKRRSRLSALQGCALATKNRNR